MFFGVVVFHVIVAVSLILVVLMQSSKGEALGGSAFGGSGGGGGGGSFGGARVPFLSKVTTVLAVVFMLNSIALTLLSSQGLAVSNGRPDPNAKSITTEKMQKEIQANQASQANQVNQNVTGSELDTSASQDGSVKIEDLIKVQKTADTTGATPNPSGD